MRKCMVYFVFKDFYASFIVLRCFINITVSQYLSSCVYRMIEKSLP